MRGAGFLALACFLTTAACSGGSSPGGLAGVSGGAAGDSGAAGHQAAGTGGTDVAGTGGLAAGGAGGSAANPACANVPRCPAALSGSRECDGKGLPCSWFYRCDTYDSIVTQRAFEEFLTCTYDTAGKLVFGEWAVSGLRCAEGAQPQGPCRADAGTD
jgi:hypothetical protein